MCYKCRVVVLLLLSQDAVLPAAVLLTQPSIVSTLCEVITSFLLGASGVTTVSELSQMRIGLVFIN